MRFTLVKNVVSRIVDMRTYIVLMLVMQCLLVFGVLGIGIGLQSRNVPTLSLDSVAVHISRLQTDSIVCSEIYIFPAVDHSDCPSYENQ